MMVWLCHIASYYIWRSNRFEMLIMWSILYSIWIYIYMIWYFQIYFTQDFDNVFYVIYNGGHDTCRYLITCLCTLVLLYSWMNLCMCDGLKFSLMLQSKQVHKYSMILSYKINLYIIMFKQLVIWLKLFTTSTNSIDKIQ